jgi:sugar/nucleoside kinase (ribokinase family)
MPSRIVFAVPEVPLEARLVFLKNAKEKGAFTAASFLSDEISEVFKGDGLSFIDLLSINIDEANALVEKSSDDSKTAAYSCAERILKDYSNIELVVTDGGNGMYGFSREGDEYYPALDIHAKSNAGVGDAAFDGLLIAKVLGLPFHSTAGLSGVALANSLAALSVESPDTINFTITYKSLTEFIGEAYDYSTD